MTNAMSKEALLELLSLECSVDSFGIITYYNSDGQMHRMHGPAVVCTNEFRAWYQNGQLHRLDGPAVEHSDGSREWFHNGQLHRLDGPAVEYPSGYRAWYIKGRSLTGAERRQHVASMATA